MKIEPTKANSAPATSGAAAARTKREANAPTLSPTALRSNEGSARVELSARARELRAARQAADQAPDVRADVVADVRQRIADGRYRIDPEQIARRMIDTKA